MPPHRMTIPPLSNIILLFILNGIHVLTYEYCNQTVPEDQILQNNSHFTFHMHQPHSGDLGHPLYCWFKFRATPPGVILIEVRDVRTGRYDDPSQSCDSGFLRISDSEACSTDPWWTPPTTLCGHHAKNTVRIKRILRSSDAFVEFKSDRLQSSNGYEFEVKISDKIPPEERLPYGHLQRHLGRVPDTKCDWVIPVDECFSSCSVVSPGYPGIYPPNTRCQYLLTNFEEDRVELRMGGRQFRGKFDMRKSPNCTEDYVEVYDGMSTVNPLMGRWCGNDGDHLISTGTSLLLVFKSGPGGPKWNYSGFNVMVHDRWKDHHQGGRRVTGTVCDWSFESRDSEEGNLHTPDHMTRNVTICKYRFKVTEGQRIELELKPRKLLPDCQEYVELLNGNEVPLEKICAHNLTGRKQIFKYNITTSTASVKYYNLKGQKSNANPVWIKYKFKSEKKINYKFKSEEKTSAVVGGSGCIVNKPSVQFTISIILILTMLFV